MSIVNGSEEKKEQFLKEYSEKYIHLIPEYLRDNDSFLVFFALMCNEFNISLENIRSFTDIVSPDKVPIKFLEALGMYFNYHYQDRATQAFNRELLMRNRKLYEDRGTEKSIIMAATHGNNEGYLGGDIFIPGYEISKDLAELVVAREKIFIHSKSNFSSTHVYSDADIYRPGVLIIKLPYLDADIRNKLWEVIPAGLRLRYVIISDLTPNPVDPEDVYNFIPENGAPKSEYRTLTWYPYFRVKPIFEHGDVNPEGLDYYNEFRNNYSLNMIYSIEMSVGDGMWDVLVHSDGTRNKDRFFTPDGIFKGDYANITLKHGRRLHSGVRVIDECVYIEPSMGVSSLPLSIIRKPFDLSSIPIIPTRSQDEDKYYRITPTGEYEDRIDKQTTDSITRDITEITSELERPYSYKYHHVIKRSSNISLRSGTVSEDTHYTEILKILLLDGIDEEDIHLISWVDFLEDIHDKEALSNNAEEIISLLESTEPIIESIKNYRDVVIPNLERAYETSIDPLEKQEILNQIKITNQRIAELTTSINDIRSQIEGEIVLDYNESGYVIGSHRENGIVQNIESLLSNESDKIYLNKFNSIMQRYYIQNPIFSGISTPGDMSEYVSIMTMQPDDVLYPISEVLDYKCDYNKPWDREKWDGDESTEDTFCLYQYGENRNPFYVGEDKSRTVEFDIGGNVTWCVKCTSSTLGFDIEGSGYAPEPLVTDVFTHSNSEFSSEDSLSGRIE